MISNIFLCLRIAAISLFNLQRKLTVLLTKVQQSKKLICPPSNKVHYSYDSLGLCLFSILYIWFYAFDLLRLIFEWPWWELVCLVTLAAQFTLNCHYIAARHLYYSLGSEKNWVTQFVWLQQVLWLVMKFPEFSVCICCLMNATSFYGKFKVFSARIICWQLFISSFSLALCPMNLFHNQISMNFRTHLHFRGWW